MKPEIAIPPALGFSDGVLQGVSIFAAFPPREIANVASARDAPGLLPRAKNINPPREIIFARAKNVAHASSLKAVGEEQQANNLRAYAVSLSAMESTHPRKYRLSILELTPGEFGLSVSA